MLFETRRSSNLRGSYRQSRISTTLARSFLPRKLKSFRHFAVAVSIMATPSRAFSGQTPSTRFDYEPPVWAKDKLCTLPQAGRLNLANLPTPLHKLTPHPQFANKKDSILQRLADLDITLYVKRDDMSGGVETGGNKIRKLEFLLADALAHGCQSVVTIGGEQSNHCRATAAAARMVGMQPHLILRTGRADTIQKQKDDIGYTGNILFDRMVGSSVYTCTPGEYGRVGSQELVARLCALLKNTQDTGNAYPIPVGGSNAIGTWGYIDGVDELLAQWHSIDSKPSLDHVVFACGSGGTATGITLGMALAHEESSSESTAPQVHAVGVCDNPDYFYDHVAKLADEMGLKLPEGISTESFVRQHMIAHQGKGLGYASSTPEELDFITNLALETGIVLDPVYSGKALYHFFTSVLGGDEAESYRGKNLLFWHTGGALGLFDKGDDMLSKLTEISPAKRLDVYGKGLENGIDISKPVSTE
jgi:D-cysteine desulfhydrase